MVSDCRGQACFGVELPEIGRDNSTEVVCKNIKTVVIVQLVSVLTRLKSILKQLAIV